MTSPLQSREGLTVLGLSLERAGPARADRVVCFVLEVSGRERLRLRVPEGRLGLIPPKVDSGSEAAATNLRVPDEVLGALNDALGRFSRPEDILWLEFRAPSADLPGNFWEAALRPTAKPGVVRCPALKRPIFRLPYSPLRPLASPVPLDVILIGSSPQAKAPLPMADYLNKLARAFLSIKETEVKVHIFGDQESHARLLQLLKDRLASGSGPGAVAYDPGAAARYDAPRRTSAIQDAPGSAPSPWLRWIIDALPADRAVDVVHFVGHGYRSYDKAAIAVAASPTVNTDRFWARFVGAQSIAAFMTQVGAWAIGLSSPQPTFEASSLRLLADGLARVVPGPVCFHDLRGDGECAALLDLCRHFVSPATYPAPVTPYLAFYGRPIEHDGAPGHEAAPLDTCELPLANEATRKLFAPGNRPPRWVAASQRALEKSAAELFDCPDQSIEINPTARQGAEDALRFVTELMSGGEPTKAGDDMIRGVTTALGRRTEDLRQTYESAREALTTLQSPDPAAGPTGPDALRSLNQYCKAVDDTRRLVANLGEQRAVTGELKTAVQAAADHLEKHVSEVTTACRIAARLATSKRPAPASAPGGLRAQVPRVAAEVAEQSDRVREVVRDLSDQFDAALSSPAPETPTAAPASTNPPDGGRS